jgi:hypothetical protein
MGDDTATRRSAGCGVDPAVDAANGSHSVQPVRRVGLTANTVNRSSRSTPPAQLSIEERSADRERLRRKQPADVRLHSRRHDDPQHGEWRDRRDHQERQGESRQRVSVIDSIGSVQATYFTRSHRPLRGGFAMLHRSNAAFGGWA